jgi:hypothetical protein
MHMHETLHETIYILSESEHILYIGFWALKLSCCTQFELCELGNLQKCKDNFFSKLDKTSNIFGLGSKINKIETAQGLQVVGSNPYPIMGPFS